MLRKEGGHVPVQLAQSVLTLYKREDATERLPSPASFSLLPFAWPPPLGGSLLKWKSMVFFPLCCNVLLQGKCCISNWLTGIHPRNNVSALDEQHNLEMIYIHLYLHLFLFLFVLERWFPYLFLLNTLIRVFLKTVFMIYNLHTIKSPHF